MWSSDIQRLLALEKRVDALERKGVAGMANTEFQTLLETVIEELTTAVPHLEAAQVAMTEAWSRIISREAGDPSEAMQKMLQAVGGLLTWVQNLKEGTQ